MPIYEYECAGCERIQEMIYKIADSKDTDFLWCNHCEKSILHFKRISKTSFQLKGKGWAKDGYTNPTPGMPSGDKFIEQYRKEIADPEHPRKVGDLLKGVGRGRTDDLSDIGCPIRDLDADRHRKLHKSNAPNLTREISSTVTKKDSGDSTEDVGSD